MDNELVLIISGLALHTRVGWSKEERSYPQKLVIDLEVSCKHDEPVNGQLSKTISYSILKAQIEQLLKSNEWGLLEDMGDAITRLIFQNHPIVDEVSVLIKKFSVPGTESTGVSIKQKRSS